MSTVFRRRSADSYVIKCWKTFFFRKKLLRGAKVNVTLTKAEVEKKIQQKTEAAIGWRGHYRHPVVTKAVGDAPKPSVFDPGGVHPEILKPLGPLSSLCLLNLFNKCWNETKWPWTDSKVVFMKKPSKTNFEVPQASDHCQYPVTQKNCSNG